MTKAESATLRERAIKLGLFGLVARWDELAPPRPYRALHDRERRATSDMLADLAAQDSPSALSRRLSRY